jgi:hypothetical protein
MEKVGAAHSQPVRKCRNKVILTKMEKSQMIVNECFRRYFDEACPERSRRAQYDKMGIFTQPVRMINFVFAKSSIL